MADPDSEQSPQQKHTLEVVGEQQAVKQAAADRIARPQDLTGAEAKAAAAQEAWRPYEFDPEIKVVNGQVFRIQVSEGGFNEESYQKYLADGWGEATARNFATTKPGEEDYVLDRDATAVYKAKNISESDLALIKKSAGSVRSWADTESDKTAEATRKFKDFLSRAKAASDIEQANLDFQSKKQAYNDDRAMGIQKGLFSSNAPYMTSSNSDVNGLSSIIRGTIPDKLPPDYGLDHVVGLPAYGRGTMLPGGRMPDEAGLKNFLGGA